MFARRTAGNLLQHLVGYSAIFTEPTAYVALFTTAPTADDGTGAVEVSGGSYARQATSVATWTAASAPPPLITNGAAIVFPTATADWGTVIAGGLYDAASGGNLLIWDWLGLCPWRPATLSTASPAVVTLPAHGLPSNATVAFTTVFGGTLPALTGGSLVGQLAVAGPLSNDTFTLTSGGTPVVTSGTGSGMLRQVVPQSVPAGVTLLFPAGRLAFLMGAAVPAPLQARSVGIGSAQGVLGSVAGGGFVLGTGTSGTDVLGTGTSGTDLLGVQ